MARNARQQEIILNGKKAGATLKEMTKAAALLNTELKNMSPNAEAFGEKKAEFQKMKQRIAALNAEIKGTTNATKGATQAQNDFGRSMQGSAQAQQSFNAGGVKGIMNLGNLKNLAMRALPVLAALFSVKKVVEFANYIADLTRKFTELRNEIEHTLNTTGEQTNKAVANISGMGKALGIEATAIQEAGKAIQNSFGGDVNKNLKEMQKTLSSVSKTQREELLEQWKEYSVFAKENNMTLSQMNEILVRSSNAGIYSDKGMDTIKEFGLRMREMPKPVEDALAKIGLNGKKLQQELLTGQKSYFDVLRQVSTEMGKLPEQSQRTGEAIANIFGGAGEDAGLAFIKSLKDAGKGVDAVINKSSKMYQQNQLRIAQEKEIADSQNRISQVWEKQVQAVDNVKKSVQALVYKGILWLSEKLQPVFAFFQEKLAVVRGAIGQVIAYFGTWKKEGEQLKALLFEMFRRLTAPIRRVWEVLQSIAQGFADLYKRSERFRNIIKGIGTAIRTAFSVFVQVKTTVLGVINDIFDAVTKIITLDFSGLKKSLVGAFENAWGRIKGIGKSIKEGFEDMFNLEASQLRKAAEAREKAAEAERKQNEENWKKSADAVEKQIAKIKERNKKRAEAKRKQAELEKQQAKERRLAATEAWKKQQAKLQKLREQAAKDEAAAHKRIQRLLIETTQKELPKKIALLNLEYDEKIKAIKGNAKQREQEEKLLNKQRYAAIEQLRKEHEAKIKAEQEKRAKEAAERKKQQFEIILKAVEEQGRREVMALENKLHRGLITQEGFEAQKFELLKKNGQARLNLLEAEHGKNSIEYQNAYNAQLALIAEFQGKKNAKIKADRDKQKELEREVWNGVADVTQEGIDLVLSVIEDQKNAKLALLEQEAEEIQAFWEAQKEAENERYEAEKEMLNERYEAEKEERTERQNEEREALLEHHNEKKMIEQGRYDEDRLQAKLEYNQKKFELQEQLRALKENGQGKSAEAKRLEKELRDMDFAWKQSNLKIAHEHKVKMQEIDQSAKAETKALDKKHKAESKSSDQKHKEAVERNEATHKALLAALDKTQLAEKEKSEAEAQRIKKESGEKSKKFTVAQILIDLGREIAGYFAHPANAASLGVIGGIKAALATGRAVASIAKVNSQQYEKGGFLDAKTIANAGLALAGGGTLGQSNDAKGTGNFVVKGASHAQGGIELLDMATGTLTGHQIEGNELVVAKDYVEDNPLAVGAITRGIDLDSLLANSAPIQPLVQASNPSTNYQNGGFLDGSSATRAATIAEATQEGRGDGAMLEMMGEVKTAITELKVTQDKLTEELSDLGISYTKLDRFLVDREQYNDEDGVL